MKSDAHSLTDIVYDREERTQLDDKTVSMRKKSSSNLILNRFLNNGSLECA
ncbi:hypothetical protein ACT691_17325 [Vibrio metschnikovii]